MTKTIRIVVTNIALLCAVAAINYLLFLLIPLIHQKFFMPDDANRVNKTHRKLVAEYVKPPEKKKEKVPRRIREVTRMSQGKRGEEQYRFDFMPDLSVEGAGGVAIEQKDFEAVVFEEGEADQDIVPVYTPAVKYPQRALELEIEGSVEIEIVVDRTGKVSTVSIRRSPHPVLSTATRKAVSAWRFKPAKYQGVPVRQRALKVIEFKLD
jgi:protein TonB